jgi:ribulose-5-phosphate 4-epimerase/fuculose-1-phosphate aldolase
MLVREQPAVELAIATRILFRAGALADEGRITLRLNDVVYIGGRGVGLATITPYDIAVLLLSDGSSLQGTPPMDAVAYLDAHHRSQGAGSVVRVAVAEFISASTLRAAVVAALRRARGEEEISDETTIETVWNELVSQARISGALIGAFVSDEDPAP